MELSAELHQVLASRVGEAVDEMVGVLKDNLVLNELAGARIGKVANGDDRKSTHRFGHINSGDEAKLFCVVGLAQVLRTLPVVILQIVAVITKAGFVHPTG